MTLRMSFFVCFSVLASSLSFRTQFHSVLAFFGVVDALVPGPFWFIVRSFPAFSIQFLFFARGFGLAFIRRELAHPCLMRLLSFLFLLRARF